MRTVHDYSALNAVTVRDHYPLPLISDLLDRLQKARVFTKLDLRNAYNLIWMKEGHEYLTAFDTRYGKYEYLVMPFGLSNCGAVFSRFMNQIFSDLLDKFVILYLDDILVFSEDETAHTTHVRDVLQRLRENKLFAKLEKCAFDLTQLDYLGYRISTGGIEMDPAKVQTILSWKPPPQRKRSAKVFRICQFLQKIYPQVC